MVRIQVDLFNFQDGGLDRQTGQYNFAKLLAAFEMGPIPDILIVNEAKGWASDNGQPFIRALSALSELGPHYIGMLTYSPGELGSALIYNSAKLQRINWHSGPGVLRDKQNVARLAVKGKEILVIPEHWSPTSRVTRGIQAARVSRYGGDPTPTVLLGDLNETASGPHLPRRDWRKATPSMKHGRGIEVKGKWVEDTAAVDRLIGRWRGPNGPRVNGMGFHAVAELAARTGTPPQQAFRPTVNEGIDPGGATLIDWILVNDALLRQGKVVPGSYHVHVPNHNNPARYFSDHRRVSVKLEI